jgi:hypothetical protein
MKLKNVNMKKIEHTMYGVKLYFKLVWNKLKETRDFTFTYTLLES